jgi:DNA primase
VNQITEQTKKALNILGLNEFKEGGKYLQLSCPFWKKTHGKPDRNPSFAIWSEYNVAKCFSCGYKSNLATFFNSYAEYIDKDVNFDFLNFYVYLDFEDKKTAENFVLEEDILNCFSKESAPLKKYLNSRAEPIDFDQLDFQLYYDSQFKNLVCPVRDISGELLGATGRNMSGSDIKHHHYFGFLTSKSLLGLEQNKHSRVLIVEGLTDYLNCKAKINELNLDYDVVATMTCSLDYWQANRVIDLGKPVYLAWDQDAAANKKRPDAINKLKDCIKLYDVSWSNLNDKKEIKDIGDFTLAEFQNLLG